MTENLCTQNNSISCIPKGTYILTSKGYKKVEKLKLNDLIITPDIREVPIIKILKSTHEYNKNTAPRIIPKNMFFNNYPSEDIKLSTGHGILVGDYIFIDCLTDKYKNLIKIEDRESFKNNNYKVEYYHIALPNFFTDNLISNGTIIESYPLNLVYQRDYNYIEYPLNGLFKKLRV